MPSRWSAASALSLDVGACLLWGAGRLDAAALLHLAASIVGLVVLRRMLPERLLAQAPRAAPLAIGLLIFVPVAGFAGIALGFLAPVRRQRLPAPPTPLRRGRPPTEHGPAPRRDDGAMAVLAASRSLPTARAVPMLQAGLSSDVDEARLLAHALLLKRERAAEARFGLCDRAVSEGGTAVGYLRAAQARADLIDSGLVDGEARQQAVIEALAHVARGLAARPDDGRLHLVRARLLLAHGDAATAHQALCEAAARGLPPCRLAPYLWRARLALRPRLVRAG